MTGLEVTLWAECYREAGEARYKGNEESVVLLSHCCPLRYWLDAHFLHANHEAIIASSLGQATGPLCITDQGFMQ